MPSVCSTLAPCASTRAGSSRTVELRISAADLRDLHLLEYWNPRTERWTTARGGYEVTVGTSVDTALSDGFTIH